MLVSALICASSLIATPLVSQTKPRATDPTKGTVQLPGDNGKLKTTYQLGEKGSELHFTLDSATLCMDYAAPDDVFIAGKAQRLLALDFTVQNPQNRDMKLGSRSFAFTVVSPDDENAKFTGYLLHGQKKSHLDQDLKPAQKTKCTIVMPIHEVGPVNKIIVQRGNAPVVRFDLTGKIPALKTIFTKDGVDAITNGGAVSLKQPFDMYGFDVTLDEVTKTTAKIKGYEPYKDFTYVVVKATFANRLARANKVGFQYFTPELKDAGGKVIVWNRAILNLLDDEYLGQEVEPGGSISGRYYFMVANNALAAPLKFKFTDANSERFVTMEIAP